MAGVESIYMTEEELLVLLAGKGKRYWYGIDSREEEEQRNPFKRRIYIGFWETYIKRNT